MQLDFRPRHKPGHDLATRLDRTATAIRSEFTRLIEDISTPHRDNLDWWTSSPPSRNTITSPLFRYCCLLALLTELLEDGNDTFEIITDSEAMRTILAQLTAQNDGRIKILLQISLKERFRRKLALPYNLTRIPAIHGLRFLAAKLSGRPKAMDKSAAITLIDTFLYGPDLADRHYTGLWESLNEAAKERTFFLPTLHGIKNYFSFFRSVRKSPINILVEEDFLRPRDYIHAWGQWLRTRKIRIGPVLLRGINIAPLINEELKAHKGYYPAFLARLKYHFIERLQTAGIPLRLAIIWFENQAADKGLVAALRKYYPGIPLKGYQGFIASPLYLSLYPTTMELAQKIVPREIAVIGRGLVSRITEFCPDGLKISLAPAFRFQDVWQERRNYPDKRCYTVLVALPGTLQESIELLELIRNCSRKKAWPDLRLLIKPHPDHRPAAIANNFQKSWPGLINSFVEGTFTAWVEKANLLISAASSACLHTLALGIPVIIMESPRGLGHNPVPESLNSDIWRLCGNADELATGIEFYRTGGEAMRKEHERVGRLLRENYFMPVTRENIASFLNL